jgi:5'-3' exonuclease
MKTHLIIDFMHLVHRAKYVKQYLSIPVTSVRETEEEGVYSVSLLGKDFEYLSSETGYIEDYKTSLQIKENSMELRTTTVFMTLKLIENAIKNFGGSDNVDVTLCFDSRKNNRKEESADYKSNRHTGWTLDDHSDVELLEHVLGLVGYNCLKVSGYEADDLVHWANVKYKDRYSQTIILTNDMDLLYNVSGNTKLYIRRTKEKDYILIDESNADALCSQRYGIEMPYTSIMLFKSLVGDTSDGIKGVSGYGKKTFEKMINSLTGYDKASLLESDNVLSVIKSLSLGAIKEQQGIDALELVKPQEIDLDLITEPHPIDLNTKENVYKELSIHLV